MLILALIVVCSQLVFPFNPAAVTEYDKLLYYPLQYTRGILFDWIPFSLGDLLYVAGGIWLLAVIVTWIRLAFKFQANKLRLVSSVIRVLNTALCIYLFFILGWGANYYKLPLRASWALRAYNDTTDLVAFDSILVGRLNALSPVYHPMTLLEVNRLSLANYKVFTDSRVTPYGLLIKPTMFSYFMDRIAIEGYYNPFTGEGQVVEGLPGFMLPFIISHEMAHQAGIAAEGDANLIAYALGTVSGDASFNYSANLNIWLYVNARLFRRDSIRAKSFEARLNTLTRAHLDTLDAISKLSDNDVSRYSAGMYDSYLKMQQQKDGIRSYGSVIANAWLFELKRKREGTTIIHIP